MSDRERELWWGERWQEGGRGSSSTRWRTISRDLQHRERVDSSSWTAKGPARRQELHSEFCRDQSCPNSNRPLSEASSCLAWHITRTGGFLSFEDPPGGRVNHPSRQSSHSNFGLTMRTRPIHLIRGSGCRELAQPGLRAVGERPETQRRQSSVPNQWVENKQRIHCGEK